MQRSWVVLPSDAAVRLDVLLARELSMSRQRVRRMLAAGVVRVNGRPVGEADKGRPLAVGDCIGVEAVTFEIVPRGDLPLTVLQAGADFVVVDKPAGVGVHPLHPGETGTVLNAVAARYPQLPGIGEGELRSGVVHRLDVEASGCLAIALTQARWQALRDAFGEHRIVKRYAAVVAGRLEGECAETMELYVARHKPALVKVRRGHARERRSPAARTCTLTWRSVRATDSATLLEIDLGTGHLHQIRVMLAHLGHPVLGDAIYGEAGSAARLMLHATALKHGDLDALSPPPTAFTAL